MPRKLFCQLSPAAYRLAIRKNVLRRKVQDALARTPFALTRSAAPLEHRVYTARSLIRRTLGSVDMRLQDNKAQNLALAAPKVDGVLIRPGEVFSFWRLVGPVCAADGYLPGLTVSCDSLGEGVGGGMCQFTNLLHWLVLHSPLTVVERHHHAQDLFPDHGRQIPFGTGTSIFYNYLDFRFRNDTDDTYQILVHSDGTYLCGELRCSAAQPCAVHIRTEGERFVREADGAVYRCGTVVRRFVDKRTGLETASDVVQVNHARVVYDVSGLDVQTAAP